MIYRSIPVRLGRGYLDCCGVDAHEPTHCSTAGVPESTNHLCLREIAMKLRGDEGDPVKELLQDIVLVLRVLRGYLCALDVRILVDGCLRILGVAGMLYDASGTAACTIVVRRTDASKALNSSSLNFLYSSISFVAWVRASLSFWTRSATQIVNWAISRSKAARVHWRACCTTFAASFSASNKVWILCDCWVA